MGTIINLKSGGEFGIWGITNSDGKYTYYSDYTSASLAALPGDTIELFANVVEKNSMVLINRVNINLNGYSFTLDSPDVEDAITDNGIGVSCTIYNGIVYRTGGFESLSDSRTCYISNFATELTLNGVTLINQFGTCTRNAGKIIGGIHSTKIEYYSGQAYAYYQDTSGQLTGGKCYSVETTCSRITGGYVDDSYFYSLSYTAIFDSGISVLNNCTGESDGSTAIYQIGGGILNNCIGFSSFGTGIYSNGNLNNCTGISFASVGIQYLPTIPDNTMNNCVATSWTTYGLAVLSTNTKIYNTTGISMGGPASQLSGEVYNSSFESRWNDANGNAIVIISAYALNNVFNCTLKTLNAAANGIYCNVATTTKYGNNVIVGTSNIAHANVSQTQTNVEDSYGNIIVG